MSRIRPLAAKVGELAADVAFIKTRRHRHITVELADLAIGATSVPVALDPPVTAAYSVQVGPVAAAAAVGLLTAGVQPNSKQATGFTLLVLNRTAGIITAAGLDVLVVPD